MKYTCAYKTSDGVRHEVSLEATSREAVFETLRAQGIRPIKVVAADGSKANGEVYGVRKRVVVSVVVAVSLMSGLMAFWLGQGRASGSLQALAQDRHQVYGDPATIQEIETGTLKVARTEVERFLLNYAIPGRAATVVPSPPELKTQDLSFTPLSSVDRPEVTAYKQILNGLKAEAKAYLEGGGTWRGFISELNARQQREIEIYERTRRELETCTDRTLRDKRNAALRAMGLRTIPRPRK